MPTIPVGYAHVMAKISLSGDPGPMAVTLGLDVSTNGVDQLIADAISGYIGTPLKSLMSSVYTFDGVDVAHRVGAGDPVHWTSVTGAGPGAGAATAIPQNTAFLVHKRTALGGRDNRGRMYIPGVGESNADTVGTLTAGTITAANAAFATMLTNLQSISAEPVVLHSAVGPTPTVITSITIDPKVATQRRRLR